MTMLQHPHIYTRSPLTTYHMDEKLLIQFVLYEVMRTFQQLETINKLLKKITINNKGRFRTQDKKHLDSLAEAIIALSGQTHTHYYVFTWNLTEGILAKLKYYCSQLAKNLDDTEIDTTKIKYNADRAWIHSVEMLDQLRLMRLSSVELSSTYEELKEFYNKTVKRSERLSKVIGNCLKHYLLDDHVVLFLLKFQQPLDTIYGDGFINTLFSRYYKDGIEEVKAMINSNNAEQCLLQATTDIKIVTTTRL